MLADGEVAVGRRRLTTLSAAAMGSGAALVVTVITRVSLGLTLACAAVCVGAVGWHTWKRLPDAVHPVLLERVRTGLVAGLPATAAYDVARLALVRATGLRIWPFDTFPLFGQAILGSSAPHSATIIVGTMYHYLNGMCFSVGYSVLFRRRFFLWGVAWAMGLEALMLIVYPRWLPALNRVLGEFTAVSLTGHVAFGLTIGLVAQLAPFQWGRWRRLLGG